MGHAAGGHCRLSPRAPVVLSTAGCTSTTAGGQGQPLHGPQRSRDVPASAHPCSLQGSLPRRSAPWLCTHTLCFPCPAAGPRSVHTATRMGQQEPAAEPAPLTRQRPPRTGRWPGRCPGWTTCRERSPSGTWTGRNTPNQHAGTVHGPTTGTGQPSTQLGRGMPGISGNSPGHIEAEAQVKYCVADPWKARATGKPSDRHQPRCQAEVRSTARRRVSGRTGGMVLRGKVPPQSSPTPQHLLHLHPPMAQPRWRAPARGSELLSVSRQG